MFNKHYWTKLSKEFNAYTEKSSYDRPRTIQIEHTGFFPNHIAHRGLNHNESSLLDFGTRIIEADSVHFAYSRRFNSVSLYIKSTVHSYDSGTYLEFTRNGKTVSVTMYDNADKTPWQIEQVLGKDVSVDLFQSYNQTDFQTALTNAGCNILVFFRFNVQISLRIPHMLPSIGTPNYAKPIKQGIELGWTSHGTYNSLPNVIKVSRVSTIQAVKLYELGIENRGYYSHDLKCSIPKAQAKSAKRFFDKRFKVKG
jgi:hypothetical protein